MEKLPEKNGSDFDKESEWNQCAKGDLKIGKESCKEEKRGAHFRDTEGAWKVRKDEECREWYDDEEVSDSLCNDDPV